MKTVKTVRYLPPFHVKIMKTVKTFLCLDMLLSPNVFTRVRGGALDISAEVFLIVSAFCLFSLKCVCGAGAGLKEGGGAIYPCYKGEHYTS